MTLKERIKQYCKTSGISVSQFERRSGLSNGYFNQVANSPGRDKLSNILNAFPDINRDWLLHGEGEMLKPAKNPFSQMTEQQIEDIATETLAEKLMELYRTGEIYPASIHDKIVAEKNEEIAKRDNQIAELRREVWELQQQLTKK